MTKIKVLGPKGESWVKWIGGSWKWAAATTSEFNRACRSAQPKLVLFGPDDT